MSDHRQISCIVAHIWNELPEDKKIVYKRRAEEEKAIHKAAYPNYRYAPIGRPRSVVKQRSNRSNTNETLRCRKVAELYMAGLKGEDLVSAVKALDETIAPEPSSPQYVSPPRQKRTRPRSQSQSMKKQQKQINVPIPPSPSPSPQPSSGLPKTGVCVGSLEVCALLQTGIELPTKSRAPSPEHAFTIGEFDLLHGCSSMQKLSTKSGLMHDVVHEPESMSGFADLGSMDESSDVFSNLTLGQLFRATPELPDSPDSGLSYFTALSVNDSDESGEVFHASPETPFPTSDEALFSNTNPRKATPFQLEEKEIFDAHLGDNMFMYTDSRDMAEFDQYLDL